MKKASLPASNLFQRSALWAALSLSLIGNAEALTLSRPIVQSKQGEALRVEIDISEITMAEQIDFQATLASPDVYKAAKVEIPLVNGRPLDINVQLLRRDHGAHYLKITSKQPVNGNFLDLLIDLRWATGRLLRDVSLSIDDAGNKKVSPPAMLGQSPTSSTAAKAPVANAEKNKSESKSSDSSGKIRVQRGDTASGLASDKTPDGVSLDQMLVALLRSNPDAFVDANINRMKEGALLTLPSEQDAKAVPRDEARRQIQTQTKDFQAYRAELAARAPGGTVPKVARDTAGKLEATVDNKNAKPNQDKLTLAKPSSKGTAGEEKIAQQREAQDVAARAAELSRNISELGKIAAATAAPASEAASAAAIVPVEVPASEAAANSKWMDELLNNSLTPVGAGSLIALLALIALWRRRVAKNANEDDIEGLPPLNVKFNLDLPEHEGSDPIERGDIHEVVSHTQEPHEHPHDHAHASDAPQQAERPTMSIPDISLELDEPSTAAGPYQVRIDLADELWNLGQLHTSRALMEEVANEATGADKEKALKWLAERG